MLYCLLIQLIYLHLQIHFFFNLLLQFSMSFQDVYTYNYWYEQSYSLNNIHTVFISKVPVTNYSSTYDTRHHVLRLASHRSNVPI